jgi:hypothetical protein
LTQALLLPLRQLPQELLRRPQFQPLCLPPLPLPPTLAQLLPSQFQGFRQLVPQPQPLPPLPQPQSPLHLELHPLQYQPF